MIGRRFLRGIDLGCVIGIYIAPRLSRPTAAMRVISETILPQVNGAMRHPV